MVIATRSLEPGQQVGNAISAQGGEALVVQTLLESRRAVQDVIHAALDHFGSLDIVLHNAASMTPGAISAVTDEELDDILTVNLKAAFWFVAEALEPLRSSSSGRFLFTSSITGNAQAHPNYAAYGTSKAGLNGFIRQAAFELAREGLTVNGVAPGVTLTEAVKSALGPDALATFAGIIPRGQAASPEEVAHALLMLAHPGASHITGQVIIVDGGQSLGSAFPQE